MIRTTAWLIPALFMVMACHTPRGTQTRDDGKLHITLLQINDVYEIAPLEGLDHDEGPREPDWEKIRSLKTLVEGGRVTAAVASQISDASASLLIASEQAVKDHGLTPRARIHHMSVRGDDPIFMLTAPIPATE